MPTRPGSQPRRELLKSRASNRAGATTLGAGRCNSFLRPNPAPRELGEAQRLNSWATTKRARGGNAPMFLLRVKWGLSPHCGRLGRVERMHHTMAAEVEEIRQGAEGKPGRVGTERRKL